MRTWLLEAPWWVLALVTGIPFGAIMVVNTSLSEGYGGGAVVGGVVGGVFFGAIMGPFLARLNKRTRAAMGPLPEGRETAVYRSAIRGPIPGDPDVRAAAARLAAHNLSESQRNLRRAIAAFGTFLCLSIWLAASSSPWWWCAVAMWGAAIAWSVWLPRRLRHRLARLRNESSNVK